MITLRQINACLRPNFQLYRDPTGYFYFTYDVPPDKFETESVQVYRLNRLSKAQWLACAERFYQRLRDEERL